jgi:hypothetical protein
MRENADQHVIVQRSRQLTDLAIMPEFRREDHFISKQLRPAARNARTASRLNIGEAKVKELVGRSSVRLDRLCDSLEDLQGAGSPATRSRIPRMRDAGRMARFGTAG